MPRIRPYESQISAQADFPTQGAEASDISGPGAVNVGQSVQNAGQNLGMVQRIAQSNATRAAVTDVHTMLAGARAEYTKQAIDFESKADPKDTDLWEQFYHGGNAEEPKEGSLKWYLDSYREHIQDPTARKAFDQGAAELSSQFAIHFAQMQSRMAGIQAKNQAARMIDSAQATVQSNPAEHTNVMNATMKAIDDPHSDYARVGAEQRDAIKQMATSQIASSTVRGMIGDSPQHALHSLQAGEWDSQLTGEQKIALTSAAETGIRAQEVEGRRAEAEAMRQKKAQSDASETTIMANWGLHMANPKNPAVKAMDIVDAMQNKGLDPTVGRTILNMIDENARRGPQTVHTNPSVERGLFNDIYRPDGDPKKIIDTKPIYNAYIKGQLDDSAMGRLRKELTDSRSPEGSPLGKEKAAFLKGIEPQITKPGPFGIYADPSTPEKFATFQRELDATIDRYQREGKDPRTLFDENHKDYFGKVAKSSRYQSTGFGSIATVPTAQSDNLVVPSPDRSQWNPRTDGTAKGDGFFGVLKRPDGKVSSELSTSDPIDKSGKEVLHPLIVPTLTRPELDYLLSDRKDNKPMESRIYEKAASHARDRIKAGKSPFAGPGEQVAVPGRPSLDDIFGAKK